jgi:transcriptional regulator with XRE-family HTH domain
MRARTPYEKGMSACRRGKKMSDNPYHRATARMDINYRSWLNGYAAQARKRVEPMTEALCAHAGAIAREILPRHYEELLGIPIVLLHAVEIRRCTRCQEVISKKIPDLQNLIAAMAITRITNALKLGAADIRFLRKAMNWTGRELASMLGVSGETVSRWENGKDIIGIPNEKLFRMVVGTSMRESAPAIDFDAQQITNMKIESVRPVEAIRPMCFERVKFKRPSHPKEEQWDTTVMDEAA